VTTTFAVLATGPSMSQAVADSVRHLRRVVVKDARRLAPDAEALVATDRDYWRKRDPSATAFAGRKFGVNPPRGIEAVSTSGPISSATNSGLLGLHVAILLGARRVELYGIDLSSKRGAHYFGAHVDRRNTTDARYEVFKRQFAVYPVPRGVEVINCSTESELRVYSFGHLLSDAA
jgi:hypothetical protein